MKRISRKINRIICIAMFFLLAVLTAGCSSKEALYYNYTGNVSVSLGMGAQSCIVSQMPVPVSVTVEGEYSVKAAWCELVVPAENSDFNSYRKRMTSSNSQTIEFVVPAADGSTQLMVNLLDEDEIIFYSRTCTYQFTAAEGILVGSIKAETDTVPWPEAITEGDESIAVNTVALTSSNILSDESAYSMFDFIVIDEASFEGLNDEQKSAIGWWVEGGGCIIIEGAAWTPKINNIANLKLLDWNSFSINSRVVFYISELGSGSVWYSREALSQATPLLSDSEKEELLKKLAGGTSGCYSEPQTTILAQREQELTEVIANKGTASKKPAVWTYVLLVAFFIAIVLPTIYIIFHRVSMLSLMRPVMCLAACVFAGLIYLVGTQTRFTEPFIQGVAFRQYDGDYEKESAYVSIQAPFNSSFDINISSQYSVRSVFGDLNWMLQTYSSMDRRTVSILENESVDITISDLVAFTPRYFCLERACESESRIVCISTLDSNAGGWILKNNLGFDLTSVILMYKNQIYLVNEWKAGDEINTLSGLSNGSIQSMTKLQFEEGGYKNRAGWDSGIAEYYCFLLKSWQESSDEIYAAGVCDGELSFQGSTDYYVSAETIAWAKASIQ